MRRHDRSKPGNRERPTMPTLQDFKAKVNGAKFFSKIDSKQAYHQLELHEESRFITTFSTHEGLYQYKRLLYVRDFSKCVTTKS